MELKDSQSAGFRQPFELDRDRGTPCTCDYTSVLCRRKQGMSRHEPQIVCSLP